MSRLDITPPFLINALSAGSEHAFEPTLLVPTTCSELLMPEAELPRAPPSVTRFVMMPLAHKVAVEVPAIVPLEPTIWPVLLMPNACPADPPSVPRSVNDPFCQRKGLRLISTGKP